MTKPDLIDEVAELTGCRKELVARVLEMTLLSMRNALRRGGRVKMRNFGSLVPRLVRGANQYESWEGKRVTVRFVPSEELKTMVTNPRLLHALRIHADEQPQGPLHA